MPKPNKAGGSEEEDVQNPPTRKIIKTKKGHTIQMEDADGKEMVTIIEATKHHVITLNQGGIRIKDGANGHVILFDGSGITISDKVNQGNEIKMDDQGMVCKDKNGNTITMNATGGCFGGPGIDMNAGSRICLEGPIKWLSNHKHVGNMGAATPLFPDSILELQKADLPESKIQEAWQQSGG